MTSAVGGMLNTYIHNNSPKIKNQGGGVENSCSDIVNISMQKSVLQPLMSDYSIPSYL